MGRDMKYYDPDDRMAMHRQNYQRLKDKGLSEESARQKSLESSRLNERLNKNDAKIKAAHEEASNPKNNKL